MTLYWCYPGDQPDGPPFDITIAGAETPQEACQLLGERFPSPCVHELASPDLVTAAAGLAPGQTLHQRVTRLPLSGDKYNLGGGIIDYAGMARDGVDRS